MRNIVLKAVALLVLIVPATATTQAAPTPMLVWVYGDGESGRMLSELKPMLAGSNIDVRRKSPMESSGPFSFDPQQTLASRMYADLDAVPPASWPKLIHIGYNASAWSLFYCSQLAPGKTEATWKQEVQQYAATEATAINEGANLAAWLGMRVLISKGPGAAHKNAVAKSPLKATTAAEKVIRSCTADAFFWVSYFLGGLNTHLWVDFSGMTVDPRLGGTISASRQLNPMDVWHWEQDGVHVSTDKLKYDGNDPPRYPIVGYSKSFTVGTGPGQVPQTSLGAYRVALNVWQAYQAIQAQL